MEEEIIVTKQTPNKQRENQLNQNSEQEEIKLIKEKESKLSGEKLPPIKTFDNKEFQQSNKSEEKILSSLDLKNKDTEKNAYGKNNSIHKVDKLKGDFGAQDQEYKLQKSKTTALFQTLNINEDDYKLADVEEAKEYGRSKMFRVLNKETKKYEKLPLCCSNDKLGQFGAGIQLYFLFLRNFALLFYFMFFISFIPITNNFIQGGYLTGQGGTTSKFTLGNMANPPRYNQSNDTGNLTINDALETDFSDYLPNQHKSARIAVSFDIINMIIFSVFYIYWRFKSAYLAKEIEKQNVTVGDYSIFVDNLPKNVKRKELMEFFSQFGTVAELHFATDYMGTLKQFMKLTKAFYKEKDEEARIKRDPERKDDYHIKYKKQRYVMERNMNDNFQQQFTQYQINSIEDLPNCGVFITFQNLKTKVKVFNLYKKYNRGNILQRLICCLQKSKTVDKEHLFQDRLITVEDAEEPVNVHWENMEISNLERFLRKLGMYLVVLIIMVLSFVLLFYTSALSKEGSIICDGTDHANPTQDELDYIINLNNTIKTECFCQQQNPLYVWQDKPSGMKDECLDYFVRKGFNLFMQAMTGLVTLSVNAIVKGVLNKLEIITRSKYHSSGAENTFFSIFIILFFNIALVPFIAMSRISLEGYDFIPTRFLCSWIPWLGTEIVRQDKEYYANDFNKQWYKDVHGKYFGFFILQTFIPQIFFCFLPWLWHKVRNFVVKFKYLTVTQKDANKWCTPPIFKLPQRFGEALALMFTAYMFSAGAPFLCFFAGTCLTSRYFVDKYTVLRVFQRPSYADSTINTLTLQWLPNCITVHCVFAILMFSVPSVFPQSIGDFYNDGNFSNWSDLINYRIFNGNSIYHTIIMVLIMIEFLFDFVLARFLKAYFIDLFHNDDDLISMELYNKDQGTYTDVLPKMKQLSGLSTYDILQNDTYRDMINSMIHFIAKQKKLKIIKQ